MTKKVETFAEIDKNMESGSHIISKEEAIKQLEKIQAIPYDEIAFMLCIKRIPGGFATYGIPHVKNLNEIVTVSKALFNMAEQFKKSMMESVEKSMSESKTE